MAKGRSRLGNLTSSKRMTRTLWILPAVFQQQLASVTAQNFLNTEIALTDTLSDDAWLNSLVFDNSHTYSYEAHPVIHSRYARAVDTGSGASLYEQLQQQIASNTDPCQNGATASINTSADPNYIVCTCTAEYTHSSSDVTTQYCDLKIDDCTTDICGSSGSTCTDATRTAYSVQSYSCACDAGYSITGATGAAPTPEGICSLTDNCAASPCNSRGECTNGVNTFTCSCNYGYSDTTCSTNDNECSATTDPCGTNGVCNDNTGDSAGYWCDCNSGYRGSPCTEVPRLWSDIPIQIFLRNIEVCLTNIMTLVSTYFATAFAGDDQYHGVNTIGSTCTLSTGIHDITFNLRMTEELTTTTGRKRRSTDTGSNAQKVSADWRVGYTGSSSEWRSAINKILAKFPGLLANTAVNTAISNIVAAVKVDNTNANPSVTLNSESGVVHDNNLVVNEDLNACEDATYRCKNGGTCTDKAGNSGERTCTCQKGYEGDDCGTTTDNCVGITCQNGGTCKNNIGSYECQCKTGFTGTHCETDTFCTTHTCQNSATCSSGACQCSAIKTATVEYRGLLCETTDYCTGSTPVTCNGNGQCLSLSVTSSYKCQCNTGYTGTLCATDINECLVPFPPCVAGNTVKCNDKAGDYECVCKTGFEGKKCQTKTHTCANNPCQNGALCDETPTAYKCQCVSGYTGNNCQININDCRPNSCSGHGDCKDQLNAFTCECHKWWKGPICDKPMACAHNACAANGTCVPHEPTMSYHCKCADGYVGTFCDLKNPCKEANACSGRGICTIDYVRKARICECGNGSSGKNCEIEATTAAPVTLPPGFAPQWKVSFDGFIFEKWTQDMSSFNSVRAYLMRQIVERDTNLMFMRSYRGFAKEQGDIGVVHVVQFDSASVSQFCGNSSHTDGLSSLIKVQLEYYVQSRLDAAALTSHIKSVLKTGTWTLDNDGPDFSYECSKYNAIQIGAKGDISQCWPSKIPSTYTDAYSQYCSNDPNSSGKLGAGLAVVFAILASLWLL